ncbi:MAG: hypoxanthine phosphoribosyltransferase [Bdellovibrionales bacterium]|jgi:hypoxanthine phosphoribosyltransferase|nr:hypoxanthine phosphoribosyltransferase [Bdellovibrionales bacterium]
MASNKKPSSNRGQLKDEMIAFLTSKDIAALVEKLAREIEADYKGKDLIFICPLKGSCLFLADLVRKIDRPLQVDFVQLGAVEKGGAIRMLKDISVNIAGKHVVIVEEIIDTGRTLDFLRQRLLASSPASLKILTLLDKPARRELQLKPDYTGQSIEDRYMVGYGMDSEEIGRNYSEIFYFKQ